MQKIQTHLWDEIKRKLFHSLGLVYLPGFLYIQRETYIFILLILTGNVFLLEIIRHRHTALNEKIINIFGEILRPNERHQFSGIFWMLLGVTSVSILIRPIPIVVTVLLYLIIGDTAASLVGKGIKGPRWPRSEKRFSGSFACFVSCVIVGIILLPMHANWLGIVIGALIATVVEVGYLPINDNFLIPFATSIVMTYVYKLTPVFV